MKFAIMMMFSTSLPFPHISLTHLTHSIPYASNQPLKFLLLQYKQEIEVNIRLQKLLGLLYQLLLCHTHSLTH